MIADGAAVGDRIGRLVASARAAALAGRLLVLLGLVGCVRPQAQPCGDRVCDVGDVCTPGGCATPADVAACAGLSDGTTCQAANGGLGTCDQGACRTNLCGNGVIDPGEVCDGDAGVDTSVGETCSADCKRIQVCGNGVVDPGEQCDDGNQNPADGCDACTLTKWSAAALIGANTAVFPALRIATNGDGSLYFTDGVFVRRIDASGAVTTVAGNGTVGYSGDGGPATSAQLNLPIGLAVDGLGNLYIADLYNSRIRRVDTAGIITTIAGNGNFGYSGDGGPATSAQLSGPTGVAVDGLGTVYIADNNNFVVRRVDLNGVITTIAGNGTYGYSGDGGPAISAQLNYPLDVALDRVGNVYISDPYNFAIRRVTKAGVITTFAGNGTSGYSGDGAPAKTAQLTYPSQLAVDAVGDVYIGDGNGTIRRVDTGGVITTVAGTGTAGFSGDGGPATSAQLGAEYDGYSPGVAVDLLGNVYIADTSNGRVRRVDTTGTIASIAGDGTLDLGEGGAATSTQISICTPSGVAVDASGSVYIAEGCFSRVSRVDSNGLFTTVAGTGVAGYTGDGGAARNAQLGTPAGVALDGMGNLYITDYGDQRVRRVDSAGVITTIAGTGIAGYSGDGGPATSAQLNGPSGVAIDGIGNVYIADTVNGRIRRIDTAGVITTVAAGNGVAVDGAGNLYIPGTNVVRKIDTTGTVTTIAGTGTAGYSGDGGPATSAQLTGPGGVAVDPSGNIYILDGWGRIRRVDTAGIITTVAGDGTTTAFNGDGGPAVAASFYYLTALAVEAAGDVYVADQSNTVRRIRAGVIETIAGQIDPPGMGPVAHARFYDPRALVVSPPLTLVAGGSLGTVQAARSDTGRLADVVGRYPQPTAAGNRARFRSQSFGDVDGIAYDAQARQIYLSESTANRLDVVTMVDPNDATTWTIAPFANVSGTAGFANGAAASARFHGPTGLYLDPVAHVLYVADSGNHVVRAIDLATTTVSTVAGMPDVRGFFGDGGAATAAGLFLPQAITKCGNGDLFIADTGNNRVRRVDATTGNISTVLGVGVAAWSGEGVPARDFPVDAPLGLACDAFGNVFVTSTTAIRLLAASDQHAVDGSGDVQTIYGGPPRAFPADATRCLTGLAVIDAATVQVVDSCTGLLVELHRHTGQ
jgi:cysteine-rich repeat protein